MKKFVSLLLFLAAVTLAAAPAWDFTPGGNGAEWKITKATESRWTPEGLYIHGLKSAGLEITLPEGLDAAEFPFLEIVFASAEYSSGELYFARENEDFSPERSIKITASGFNVFMTRRIDCRKNKHWKGIIRKLRLNPVSRDMDNSVVKSLLFFNGSGGEVLNGSFETPQLKNKKAALHWKFTGDAEITSEAYAGKKALRLGDNGSVSTEFELKKQYSFALEMAYKLNKQGKISLIYRNIFDKEIGKKDLILPAAGKYQFFKQQITAPVDTAYVTMTLQGRGNIDAVNVKLVKPVSEKYRWHDAHWIWDRPNASSEQKPIRFRKSFTIQDTRSIRRMILQVNTRNVTGKVPIDTVKVYLNGKPVDTAVKTAAWSWKNYYDLLPLIKEGKNVIAFEVINDMSPGALLAEILVENEGDTPARFQRFGTTPSWKTFDSSDQGDSWKTVEFNDSHWRNALLRGQPSPGSFCRIPYRFLGTSGTIDLGNLSFPGKISGNKTGRITADVKLSPMAGNDEITEKAALFFHLIDFKRNVTVKFKVHRFTAADLKNKSVKLDFPLESRYLRAGEYELRIYADRLAFAAAPAGYTLNKTANFISRKVTVTEQRKSQLPKVTISDFDKIPRININGVPHFSQRFTHGNHTQEATEENLLIADLATSKSQPIMDVWVARWTYGPNGEVDFSGCDTFMMSYLSRHPGAKFNIHWTLDTAGTRGPLRQWLLAHPQAWAKDSKNSYQSGTYLATNVVASMASELWQDAIADAAKKFVKHISESPYADSIIGIMPCCGISSEWLYWGSQAQAFMDYSDPYQNGFRKFLQKKYGTVDKLNAAWKKSFKSFSEAAIPSEAERKNIRYTDFLLHEENRPVIDMREFHSLTVSDSIIKACRAIKESSNDHLLTGVYYGYSMYVAGPYQAPFSGHQALDRILRSPYVDFLFSPCRYDDRSVGGASGFMAPAASIRSHKKMWNNEADNRLLHSWNSSGRSDTVRGSRSVIEREFASVFAKASAQAWLDFGEGWLPYDSRLVDVFEKCLQIARKLAAENAVGPDKDNAIAVVLDEKAMFNAPYKQRLFLNLVGIYPHLLRTGTGVHWYLMSDLDKLEPYKCIIFTPTVTQISAEQSKFIAEKLKNNNRTLVFLYSTGIYNGEKLDPANTGREAGIKIRFHKSYGKHSLHKTAVNDPMLKYLPDNYCFAFAEASDFILLPENTDGWKTLFILNSRKGPPAVISKNYGDWTAVYSASNGLTAPLLRGIAENAGIHIFNRHNGDVTYTAKGFFAVHTAVGGKRTFTVPAGSAKVVELISGKEYKLNNNSFEVELTPESTVMFRVYNK